MSISLSYPSPPPLTLSQGCHLEGPFISLEKKGAHPEQYLRSFQSGGMLDLIETYGTLDNVAMVTLAPELPNSEKVVRELAQRGITVSLGMCIKLGIEYSLCRPMTYAYA